MLLLHNHLVLLGNQVLLDHQVLVNQVHLVPLGHRQVHLDRLVPQVLVDQDHPDRQDHLAHLLDPLAHLGHQALQAGHQVRQALLEAVLQVRLVHRVRLEHHVPDLLVLRVHHLDHLDLLDHQAAAPVHRDPLDRRADLVAHQAHPAHLVHRDLVLLVPLAAAHLDHLEVVLLARQVLDHQARQDLVRRVHQALDHQARQALVRRVHQEERLQARQAVPDQAHRVHPAARVRDHRDLVHQALQVAVHLVLLAVAHQDRPEAARRAHLAQLDHQVRVARREAAPRQAAASRRPT